MDTREYKTVDKSDWGRGEWQNEPDKVQWQDETTGLPCLIVRGPSGALCGYVGVAESHPDFRKGYDGVDVDVHGGLTFADFCADSDDESKHICHVPGPGEPDRVWWLGFDCSHSGDYSPKYNSKYGPSGYETYAALPYVKHQVTKLAHQLAERSTISAQPSGVSHE